MVGLGSFQFIRNELDEWGWRALPKVGSEFLHKFPHADADSIWEFEWDLLIVLDSCRYDWMKVVAPEYDFIDSVDHIWSVGGHSKEWLEETFSKGPLDQIRNTAYVSANPFTENVSGLPFAYLDNLNKLDYGVNSPVAPAHVVTDRAVDAGRSRSFDQQIVHYMQPHKPFLEREGGRRSVRMIERTTGIDIYHSYFTGYRTKSDLRDGYINNLRYVLEEVKVLLSNFDAGRVIITADHGHALGERFLWDHRPGIQHPVIRQVPWIKTTAEDAGGLEPNKYETTSRSEKEIQDRLEALGYR